MNIKNIFKKWFGNVTECILCLIAAVVAVGVTFIVYEQDTGAPTPREMTVLQNDTLQFFKLPGLDYKLYNFGNKKVKLPKQAFVKKGEKVTVLGAVKANSSYEARFVVRKSDGTQGMLSQLTLERKGIIVHADEKHGLEVGDSIEVVSLTKSGQSPKTTVRKLSNDSIIKDVRATYYVTETINEWNEHLMQLDGNTLCSFRKFEEQYLKPQSDSSLLQIPTYTMVEYKDTLHVVIPLKVFDPATGTFFLPIMKYGKDGSCLGYDKKTYKTHYNAWLLKWLPGADWVFEQPWMTVVLNESMHQSDDMQTKGTITGTWGTIIGIVTICVLAILFIIWIGSWGIVVPLILNGLMGFRYIYYIFNNTILGFVIVLLTLAWAYICTILMLSYTYWFVYIPVILVTEVWMLRITYGLLSVRCSKCGRLHTIHEIDCELTEEEESDWVHESRFNKTVKSWKERYTTYTPVDHYVVETRNGVEMSRRHTGTSKTNVQQHTIQHGTDLYDDYEVKYRYSYYKITMQCSECENLTYRNEVEQKEIERRYKGQHTESY